jgi:hypothetical protein
VEQINSRVAIQFSQLADDASNTPPQFHSHSFSPRLDFAASCRQFLRGGTYDGSTGRVRDQAVDIPVGGLGKQGSGNHRQDTYEKGNNEGEAHVGSLASNGNVCHSPVRFAGRSAVSTTKLRRYFKTERTMRMAGIPDSMALGMVGIDFQRGEQESLAGRFVTAALGLDRHEYRVDLRQCFWVVAL